MINFSRSQQNTAEIMVQCSSASIHMIDPQFQSRRILDRCGRAISDEDNIYLRQTSVSCAATAAMLIGMLIIALAVGALFNASSSLRGLSDLGVLLFSLLNCLFLYFLWRQRNMYLSLWRALKNALLLVNAIGISAEGIRLCRVLGFLNQHFLWETVVDIRIVHDFATEEKTEKEVLLEITSSSKKVEKLRLKSIRSIEERKLLVEAFKIYARRAIDVDDIARMVRASDVQDIAFTQLWSEALRSSLPRSSSSVLQAERLLQDGRFFIENQIGGGGQGVIYLAEMLDMADQKTRVALKEYVLPDQEHLFDRKRAIEQFEREVHLLARLKHKSLANLVDAFIEDHRAYLVLEYLEGTNLRDAVKVSGKLSAESCCEISLQLCDVLQYLHSFTPPVVHLDISPENVVVLSDGTIKLIDFNTSSDGSGLRTKLIAGKQRYMPPEQYRNEVSPQCDIYSLGCTMFFMLTGTEPEPLTVLHPKDLVSSLLPELDVIVSEATSLNRETRTTKIEMVRDRLLALSPKTLVESGV
jgi:tRNA A-37 threonylcarbamoyl transferase component Bud32